MDDETVSVHRLLAKVVREDAHARADTSALERALVALEHAFPADPSDPAGWPMSEQLLAHVIAVADAAAGVPDTGRRRRWRRSSRRSRSDAQAIELLNRACSYLIWTERSARGLALAQRTVATAARILGAEHQETLQARNHEAYSHRQVGHASQAIALFEVLLADRQRILGPSTRTRSPPATSSPAPTARRAATRRRPRSKRAPVGGDAR
ncbi:MAG: hypothetical protein ACLP01_19505 [Solirubrobacteraceae bacterium]